MKSGDRCPRTGVTIGCPVIDRREREAFERANPWYREQGIAGRYCEGRVPFGETCWKCATSSVCPYAS